MLEIFQLTTIGRNQHQTYWGLEDRILALKKQRHFFGRKSCPVYEERQSVLGLVYLRLAGRAAKRFEFGIFFYYFLSFSRAPIRSSRGGLLLISWTSI